MDKLVFVNEEFQVAVCTACMSGVWGDVLRHFADHHKETWKKCKKQLKEHVRGMKLASRDDVLATTTEAHEVREPVMRIALHDGWSCEEDGCLFLSTSKDAMRNHGGEVHVNTRIHTLGCCRLQTIFGRRYVRFQYLVYIPLTMRYFMVEQGVTSSARKGRVAGGLDRLIEITKSQEHDSRTSNHQLIGDNFFPVQTPWPAYTKWLERFAGQNLERLMELTEKPKPGDPFLTAVWKDEGDMFKDCH